MPLQTSGSISLNDIHVEAGGTSGTQASLNDSDIRGLTPASGKTINTSPGTEIDFGDFYGASSAASFVGSATLTYQRPRDWNSNNPLNITGAGVQAGDLVVIAITAKRRGPESGYEITGMSSLNAAFAAPTARNPQYGVYYGIWSSNDSNPYSLSTNSGSDYYSLVGAVFRNTNTSLLGSSSTSDSSGMPNPPSLSSTSGTKLIVATGHLDDDGVNMTAGSGYLLAGATFFSGTYRSSTAIQYKITSTSTTENPPEFGGTYSDAWFASTLRF